MRLLTILAVVMGFSLSAVAKDVVTRGYCMPNKSSKGGMGDILEVCTATYGTKAYGEYYLVVLSTIKGPQTFVGSAGGYNHHNCEHNICRGQLYIMGRLNADNTIEIPAPLAMNMVIEKSQTRYSGLQINLRGDLGTSNNYYTSGQHKLTR